MASAGSTPTFESVDKQIQAADLSVFQPGGKYHLAPGAAAAPAAATPNFCAAYKIVRPILELLLGTPFIPQKWKDAAQGIREPGGCALPLGAPVRLPRFHRRRSPLGDFNDMKARQDPRLLSAARAG